MGCYSYTGVEMFPKYLQGKVTIVLMCPDYKSLPLVRHILKSRNHLYWFLILRFGL